MNSDKSGFICYLCGEPLAKSDVNKDHIFQKQFIKRKQPKTNGFFYAGYLPVHKVCNNNFGCSSSKAESICYKALLLLDALQREETLWRTHKDNPNINLIAIRSDLLPGFTEEDKKFFKLIDVSGIENLRDTAFFEDKEKILPYEKPLNIALTVLAKSSAGFLVKYHGISPRTKWRILAIPYFVPSSDWDLAEILGCVEPLEVGFKIWVKKFSNGDMFIAYTINRLYVFFCFALTPDKSNFKITNDRLGSDNSYYFESNRLINLVRYNWGDNQFDDSNSSGDTVYNS